MNRLIRLLPIVLLTGCAGANISAQLRDSNTNSSMETRCAEFETDHWKYPSDKLLAQFDGWRLISTSEYTTRNKWSTRMLMCFERSYVNEQGKHPD